MKSGEMSFSRCTKAAELGSSGVATGMSRARANFSTLSNQTFSAGSSRCVTTSSMRTPCESITARQRTPTSW
jgi:hypothetical protein